MRVGVVACLLWAAPSIYGQNVFVPRQLKAIALGSMSSIHGQARAPGVDTPQWKDWIAHGLLPYHRLVRADFPVNDKAVDPQYAMSTFWFFDYKYKYGCTEEDDHVIARITDWKVRSGFDRNRSSRKSWFKNVEGLLPHEQGHLDINELYAKQLANMQLDTLPIGQGANADEAAKDLRIKLKVLYNKVLKDDQTEQDAYDAKTSHGTNQSKQLAAKAAIQKRLKEAGITYASQQSVGD